ncbi:hypothetical protein Tco_1259683 [Tanacetum coccineum]
MAMTVGLGTRGISLVVDRGLTSGKNAKSSQTVYKFINSSQQRCVMRPVKSLMKILEQSKERAFSPNLFSATHHHHLSPTAGGCGGTVVRVAAAGDGCRGGGVGGLW